MFAQNCQATNKPVTHTAAGSFGITGVGPMPSWHMATLAERVEHALLTRGMKARDLDLALAARLGKKPTSASGYVHRVLKRGQQPGADVLAAMAEILSVSERWLLAGLGSMDRDGRETPTYDSLPGWAESAEAEIEKGRAHPYAIHAAGRSPAAVHPVKVTPDFVYQAAVFWLSYAPDEERAAAMKVEAQRIKAAEDKRRT